MMKMSSAPTSFGAHAPIASVVRCTLSLMSMRVPPCAGGHAPLPQPLRREPRLGRQARHDVTVATDVDIVIRLAVAGTVGALVGLERETRHRTAGVRTHSLVAFGAALFSVAGAYGFGDLERGPNVDPARIAA